MTKRYVYFRTPEGRPYKGRDNKYAPEHILAEIGKTAKLIPNGNISWPAGFEAFRLQVALKQRLVVLDPEDAELNETDTSDIVWKTVVALIKKAPDKPLKPLELLGMADESAAMFFRKSPAKYVLIGSLSINSLPSKSIRVQDCTISSLKRRGTKFALPTFVSLRFDTKESAFSKHVKHSKYQLVKVSTEGRSIYDAAERALNTLNLLRGLWSLITTYGSWTLSGGIVSRKPLGIIHAGPIHTLHFPNGASVDNNLMWYDPDFTEDQPIYQPAKGWEQIEKKRRLAMRRLATLEYKNDLTAMLIRYVNALDQPNTDIAFLQMWSILEKITDTIGGKYDETIERTLWPFRGQDRLVSKNILESLRCRRNQYVHSGRGNQECDQIAYMIKPFVDTHLFMLISNRLNVHSLEEYGNFLALPSNITTLKERRQILTQALRVLQPKETTSSR